MQQANDKVRGRERGRSANILPNITAISKPDPRTSTTAAPNYDTQKNVGRGNLRSNVFLVIKFAFVSGSSEAELNSVVHHCDFSWEFGVSLLGAVLSDRYGGCEGSAGGLRKRGEEFGRGDHADVRRMGCLRGGPKGDVWVVKL